MSEEYSVSKCPDFVTLSGNSDADPTDTEGKKDERSDPTFRASSSSEPHLLTQNILMTFLEFKVF